MALNGIVSAAVFINLQHRRDRYKQILGELGLLFKYNNIVRRLDATYDPEKGQVGCCKSHIRALQTLCAQSSKDEFVMVFEDDFKVDKTQLEGLSDRLYKFLDTFPKANVLMLAMNPHRILPTSMSGIVRVQWGLSGTCYMVRTSYIPTLIKCMQTALQKQIHFDLEWSSIQMKDGWYGLQPPLGKQRKSYSDISKKIMFYGV